MRTLTKGLAAGAVGLGVLLAGGLALADDGSDTPSTPVCTQDGRQDREGPHDQVRDRIHDQMREGDADGGVLCDQDRTRSHDGMADAGDMPGPHAGQDHGGRRQSHTARS
jgi:hypothetical protein